MKSYSTLISTIHGLNPSGGLLKAIQFYHDCKIVKIPSSLLWGASILYYRTIVNKTGFLFSEIFLDHETGDHPECPDRLKTVKSAVDSSIIKKDLVFVEPEEATLEQISLIHLPEYIKFIMNSCKLGDRFINADTTICKKSYDIT
ncbi:MAG: hypothetical protein V3U15_03335 [Nitrospinota bacterium]